MLNFLFGAVIFVVVSFVVVLTFILVQQDKDRVTVTYDCRMLMGNWHPDVPKVVIEECKKRIKE
jgi:hypothetical protein